MSVTYKGNTLMTKGYGVSSKVSNGVSLNGDTIFRIGSVSKVFAVSQNILQSSLYILYLTMYITIKIIYQVIIVYR